MKNGAGRWMYDMSVSTRSGGAGAGPGVAATFFGGRASGAFVGAGASASSTSSTSSGGKSISPASPAHMHQPCCCNSALRSAANALGQTLTSRDLLLLLLLRLPPDLRHGWRPAPKHTNRPQQTATTTTRTRTTPPARGGAALLAVALPGRCPGRATPQGEGEREQHGDVASEISVMPSGGRVTGILRGKIMQPATAVCTHEHVSMY